jgi:transcription-repair coupling factor (superfamily II helicase)
MDETADRFGQYPQAVNNLFDLAYVKIVAAEIGAERISFKKSELAIDFGPTKTPEKSDIERWRMKINNKMEFRYGEGFSMKIKLADDQSITLKKTLRRLSS